VVLYAASNDLGDANFGTVDQSTGAFTDLGDTPGGFQMPALACDGIGQLFGSENLDPEDPLAPVDGSRCGVLYELDPADGSALETFGFILVAGADDTCLRVSDFDFNPATGVLYGVARATSERDGLYTITLTTPPVATLVGLLDPPCMGGCLERGGLAFRDDGALFLGSVGNELAQLDPADATVIGSIVAITGGPSCIESLTFRNSDDLLYGGECDSDELYTIDESTAIATLLSSDPGEDLGSLAFCGDRVALGPTPTATVTNTPGPSPTPTVTPTRTNTPTVTSTPTVTPTGQFPAVPAIPALSGGGAAILALLLAAGAVLAIVRRRS
jgi:hypothetical protein